VFLPSLDGLRQEWYDASASLGGSSGSFWRHVGGPILAPSFLGALLLLFTNAFSAYATAAALISQGSPLATLQIGASLQSEVLIGRENVGKALALGMIVIVSVVMVIYALIQRRASRWVR
jgi:putative spermidine/putrescine transport system permease protein